MVKVIELFVGGNVQRQALKETRIEREIVTISEIDKYAFIAYKKSHGDCTNLGDIKLIQNYQKHICRYIHFFVLIFHLLED